MDHMPPTSDRRDPPAPINSAEEVQKSSWFCCCIPRKATKPLHQTDSIAPHPDATGPTETDPLLHSAPPPVSTEVKYDKDPVNDDGYESPPPNGQGSTPTSPQSVCGDSIDPDDLDEYFE